MRQWRYRAISVLAVSAATVAPLAISVVTGAEHGLAASKSTQVPINKVGTAHFASLSDNEIRPGGDDVGADTAKAVANGSIRARTHAKPTSGTTPSGIIPTLPPLPVDTADSGWEGINHYQQRFTDGGNKWSLTPPDQAVCSNGTWVVESVNTAIAVYGANGGAAGSGVTSLNQFFWNDHEIDRSTSTASPHQLGDPSCVYDAGSNRFFLTVYDALSDTTGAGTGPSYVDIAVSDSGDPRGSWSIYQLNTTNDGSDGTPDRAICPCFADYPHLGTDANGLYITTNEYSSPDFDAFDGANVYAIDKKALTAHNASLHATMFSTQGLDPYKNVTYDGSTLAPALSAGTAYAPNTMYFLSSDAWSGDVPIHSEQVLVWKIANTNLISRSPGSLTLTGPQPVGVNSYYPPPRTDQKAGSVPLADCLNVTSCAKVVLGTPDRFKETEFPFDSGDTRMLQSAYADGLLWGALDTAVDVTVGGTPVTKAGIAYYVINPTSTGRPTVVKQDTLAAANGTNMSFPALGVTAAGKAVMAMSVAGKDYFPSAAYLTFDASSAPPSHVRIVGTGLGPDDDFSGYRGFEYNVPRWGDYGAASVVGGNVWIASEYIAQTCTLAQFTATDPDGRAFTCNRTRSALANWSTHIAKVTP